MRHLLFLCLIGLLVGCDGVGKPCERPSDCSAGLVCAGVRKKRCQKCAELQLCKKLGRCTYRNNDCVAASDADCERSQMCAQSGRCKAGDGRCISTGGTRAKGEEGCPCGCDRSEAMTAALAAMDDDMAHATISQTLDIIADREDAGFITEAMVAHRLRLLRHAAQRWQTAPARRTPSSTTLATRAARSALPAVDDEVLRMRGELITHGEFIELVHGRPKLQRASFRLWLQLENLSDGDLSLDPPRLDGSVPFPISRWYIEDGDGRPFDGVLRARQARSLLVIGYLGEPLESGTVKSGTLIEAVIRLRSLTLRLSSRAKRRWNGPD